MSEKFNQFYESEFNSESKEVANFLAQEYLNSVFENRTEKINREYKGLELGDINANLNILKSQIDFLENIGFRDSIPCLAIGEVNIPIDIYQYFEDREKRNTLLPLDFFQNYYDHPYRFRHIERFLNHIERSPNKLFTSESTVSVKKNLKSALSSFIEVRHASFFNTKISDHISKFFKTNQSSDNQINNNSKYLNITVNTHNHGLEILASPAYFVTWKKFGSPSSPTVGSLIPGSYIFGGSGIGVPNFVYDEIPADVPPNFNITINQF